MITLSELPSDLDDLSNSEKRRVIMRCILQQQGWFTQDDIVKALLRQNIDARRATAGYIARALHLRGYAEREEERNTRGAGIYVVRWRLIPARFQKRTG